MELLIILGVFIFLLWLASVVFSKKRKSDNDAEEMKNQTWGEALAYALALVGGVFFIIIVLGYVVKSCS